METRKTKKEIVQMLLKKQFEENNEEELINMLIDEPIAVDVDKLSISDFLSYLSSKISIDDVEIQNDNIDNIIVKLYKDFEIWKPICLYLKWK